MKLCNAYIIWEENGLNIYDLVDKKLKTYQ